jgi:putative Mg2+ transporter-C (MgtC) family protein
MIDMMPLTPSLAEIATRLLLTLAAGALIGLNRQAGGHAAGFRTTMLVGLAACLAMIQANLLLAVSGKTDHTFAVMDTLRFPLGILTGVGFIGGGAILKRGDLVTGVTTAATLWIMTAIGLCIGGGQLVLGCGGAVLAFVILSPLKLLDERMPRRQKARVTISVSGYASRPNLDQILPQGCRSRFLEMNRTQPGSHFHVTYELRWTNAVKDAEIEILAALQKEHTLERFELKNSTA